MKWEDEWLFVMFVQICILSPHYRPSNANMTPGYVQIRKHKCAVGPTEATDYLDIPLFSHISRINRSPFVVAAS